MVQGGQRIERDPRGAEELTSVCKDVKGPGSGAFAFSGIRSGRNEGRDRNNYEDHHLQNSHIALGLPCIKTAPMKKFVFSLLAFVLTGSLMAQNMRVSLGFESGVPISDFGDAVGLGLGGTLGFESPIGNNTAFMFQGGFISFMGKSYETIDWTTLQKVKATSDPTSSIPIQVGLKYYFSENQHGAYAGLLAGVHLFSVKTPELDPITFDIVYDTKMKTYFSAAPEVGFVLGSNFDIALRYQMIFAQTEIYNFDPVTYAFSTETKTVVNSYIGVRLAYMFGRGTPHPSHRLRR